LIYQSRGDLVCPALVLSSGPVQKTFQLFQPQIRFPLLGADAVNILDLDRRVIILPSISPKIRSNGIRIYRRPSKFRAQPLRVAQRLRGTTNNRV